MAKEGRTHGAIQQSAFCQEFELDHDGFGDPLDLQIGFDKNITNMPTPLSVSSSHSQTSIPPRRVASTKRSRFLCERVRRLLELFEKIVKEEFSGDAECELRTVLSGAEDSVTDDIEVPSSSQASLQLSSLATIGAIDGLTCDFCGAVIFQSFFNARHVTLQNVTERRLPPTRT